MIELIALRICFASFDDLVKFDVNSPLTGDDPLYLVNRIGLQDLIVGMVGGQNPKATDPLLIKAHDATFNVSCSLSVEWKV